MNTIPNKADIATAQLIVGYLEDVDIDYDAHDYAMTHPTVSRRHVSDMLTAVAYAREKNWSLGEEYEQKIREMSKLSRENAPRAKTIQQIQLAERGVSEASLIPDGWWNQFLTGGYDITHDQYVYLRSMRAGANVRIRNYIEEANLYREGSVGRSSRLMSAVREREAGKAAIRDYVLANRRQQNPILHVVLEDGAGQWFDQNGDVIGVGLIPPQGSIGVQIPQLDPTELGEM